LPGLLNKKYDGDDLVWGCGATAGATSLAHIDDDGLATAIRIMAGAKYWVVMRSRPEDSKEKDDVEGDLRTINAFPPDFYSKSGKGFWEGEGILLVAGDVL
jgi:hypothetical protein